MGTRRENIKILFRRVTSDDVLNRHVNGDASMNDSINHSRVEWNPYFQLARPVFKKLTDDKLEEYYQQALDSMKGDGADGTRMSVFNMLYKYANNILVNDRGTPICRYEKVLNWRDISLFLGQDLITCSFFAYHDVRNETVTDVFSWPAIINTDNHCLREILQRGLAENHFHLFGSSRIFELNWTALMNYENKIRDVSAKFENYLNRDVLVSMAYNKDSWARRLKQASVIRARLFNYVKFGFDIPNYVLSEMNDPTSNDELVQSLRFEYGYRLPKTDHVLDYALHNGLPIENYSYNRLLVGERYLLYHCFKRFYAGTLSPLYSDLFYAYLLIKNHFRGELVQVNKCAGFKNFAEYQNRKNVAVHNILYYEREQVYYALNEVLTEHDMKSFEIRISPVKSMEITYNLMRDIHQAYHDSYEEFSFDNAEHGNQQVFPYHYVFHFHKKADIPVNDPDSFTGKCRNDEVRRDVENKAKIIVDLINRYPILRRLIRGIDGCSHEDGCRPEVMAHVYRYLSNITPERPRFPFDGSALIELKRTYHVGEDYVDLTDGLRAIDEAILFLGLRKGDRLGHALALGLNSKDFYKSNKYCVCMNKQVLMDNIIWLLFKSDDLKVKIQPRLRETLTKRYHEIARDVYPSNIAHDMGTYYKAWRLRGNDPKLYRSGEYHEPNRFIEGYDYWCVDTVIPEGFHTKEVVFLYHAYHFDEHIRHRGDKTTEFLVNDEYIELINEIQFAMQMLVKQRCIGIETNPTSNFLIAGMNNFDRHPMFRFYNQGIESEHWGQRGTAQLSISINTDDQGVFDTKLENEYTVIASALERLTLPNSDRIFAPAEIYDWLDRVRLMGIEQSFAI